MKRVAVLTSGGDAAGMNAAIRAVVRAGVAHGWAVVGIRDGYAGLCRGEALHLGPRDVGGIIDRGGTILGTSRYEELKTHLGQEEAIRSLRALEIDALVVIGGNGSQRGAHSLSKRGVHVIGIASTIDNDLPGADVSIGATTAVGIALESIDRLRVTASSHNRAFLIEVMGRDCGYLALMAGIAGGAEAILIPEVELKPEELAGEIRRCYDRNKRHAIVVVAEGAAYNADAVSRYFHEHHERLGFELRVTKLGHVQRGGTPCAFDRIIASQLGAAAIDQLQAGVHGVLLGFRNGGILPLALEAAVEQVKTPDLRLLRLAATLAQ